MFRGLGFKLLERFGQGNPLAPLSYSQSWRSSSRRCSNGSPSSGEHGCGHRARFDER